MVSKSLLFFLIINVLKMFKMLDLLVEREERVLGFGSTHQQAWELNQDVTSPW